MPPPQKKADDDGVRLSWSEIFASWDVIVADLYACYGTAVDGVVGWLDLRRMILGLVGRRGSVFSMLKLSEHQNQDEIAR